MTLVESMINNQEQQGSVSAVDPRRRTVTLQRPCGPLVVDIWEPESGAQQRPVLLIHGWGGTGSYWRNTARALVEQGAPVYIPDLPGTGRSQPTAQPQDMFDQVATLAFILDTFDLQDVQVVGHSMGAAMALLLAQERPDHIERLVMTSMCFFLTEEQKQVYNSVMKVIRMTMRFRFDWMTAVPGLSRLMALRYFYRIPPDSELIDQGFFDYLHLDFDTAVACANNATDPRIELAGAQVQVPTLLIACRQDQVMPVENVDYTAEVIPHSEIRWIDHCGHLPMVEKPREYLALLEAFLF